MFFPFALISQTLYITLLLFYIRKRKKRLKKKKNYKRRFIYFYLFIQRNQPTPRIKEIYYINTSSSLQHLREVLIIGATALLNTGAARSTLEASQNLIFSVYVQISTKLTLYRIGGDIHKRHTYRRRQIIRIEEKGTIKGLSTLLLILFFPRPSYSHRP